MVYRSADTTVPMGIYSLAMAPAGAVRCAVGGREQAQDLDRIYPDETLVYRTSGPGGREWHIPPDTSLSMTGNLVHHDERIFADSYAFRLERWVENPRLDSYLVSFGRGLFGDQPGVRGSSTSLAALFQVYGTAELRGKDAVGRLELFETSSTDLVITSDMVVPVMPEDSKGLRVKAHRLVE
ncbi:cytochrome P450 [Apiospora saccharicola]|uniref:Cytochrome P450 n=1 Tax=Apiospora saccharicola TaxID=335842 RepID=A0ABR1UF30_9PEZI